MVLTSLANLLIKTGASCSIVTLLVMTSLVRPTLLMARSRSLYVSYARKFRPRNFAKRSTDDGIFLQGTTTSDLESTTLTWRTRLHYVCLMPFSTTVMHTSNKRHILPITVCHQCRQAGICTSPRVPICWGVLWWPICRMAFSVRFYQDIYVMHVQRKLNNLLTFL